MGSPSDPVEDDSPIEKVVPVKAKKLGTMLRCLYFTSNKIRVAKKPKLPKPHTDSAHAGLNLNEKVDGSGEEEEVFLKCDLRSHDWIVDSGCTKHMTRNRRLFTSYKKYDGGHVVFRSNLKGKEVRSRQYEVSSKLSFQRASKEFTKVEFDRHFCDTCSLGSQGHANNRTRNEVSTSRVLELLHLDLFGPSPIQSYGGNFYTLMIVDDHSNYTWVVFIESKDEALGKFKILSKTLENPHDSSIVAIEISHYSQTRKAYIVLSKETMRIEESLNVTFDENEGYPKSFKEARGHPIEQVIGELNERTLSQEHRKDDALNLWIPTLEQGEQRYRRITFEYFYYLHSIMISLSTSTKNFAFINAQMEERD
ncbi:retrovirus-related pol polyprotein from transposon TNT 1-94 [Tanacetum coccineum]